MDVVFHVWLTLNEFNKPESGFELRYDNFIVFFSSLETVYIGQVSLSCGNWIFALKIRLIIRHADTICGIP